MSTSNLTHSFNCFTDEVKYCLDTSGDATALQGDICSIHYYLKVIALCGLIRETLKSPKTHEIDKCFFKNVIMFWKTVV